MKKYNIINNTLGWLVFLVAAITYMLTLEPTASFWDCPEFISQGYKLEIGHPPGNPMFILAARFAANFAGGDVMAVSKCVNALSAILSAATILLLFWTITHLVKKLVAKREQTPIFGEDYVGDGDYPLFTTVKKGTLIADQYDEYEGYYVLKTAHDYLFIRKNDVEVIAQ